MAKFKLEHLLPSMKADFETVCKAFNVDIREMANAAVLSGIYPTSTLHSLFGEICGQKQHDDSHPRWAYRASVGGVGRVLPFVGPNWLNEQIYSIADDTHITTLLKRVLVSFADADKA